MNAFLLDILVDPATGTKLDYDAESQCMANSRSGQTYRVIEQVPVLLPPAPANVIASTDLHENHRSHFDYADHYQKDAEQFDYFIEHTNGASRHEESRLHQTIISLVPAGANLILDVGCGKGWVGDYFCRRGRKVISMDISTVNPVRVERRLKGANHSALVGDVFHLPLATNVVDCIIAAEIMEHVPDPGVFIRKLLSALKPGGKLIISTPYREKINYYLCVHCNHPTPQHAHLHSVDEQMIRQFLPPTGIQWQYRTFSDKYLSKLRLHVVLKFLPFRLWQFIDGIVCKTFGRPVRFILEITKE